MSNINSRERQILEMAARRGLNVANVGNTPTFRRLGYQETIPDVTFASELISARIESWIVIEDYTGSDHKTSFSIYKVNNALQTPRWNVSRLNEELLTSVIEEGESAVLEVAGAA